MAKNEKCVYLKNTFVEEKRLSGKALVLLVKLISISKHGLSLEDDNFISKDEALAILRLNNSKSDKEKYKYLYKYFDELEKNEIIDILGEYKSNARHIHYKFKVDFEIKGRKGDKYVKVPYSLINDTEDITINELMTFISIKFGHNSIECKKTNDELASLGLLSVRLIKESLDLLEAKNIIRRSGKGKGRKLILGEIRDDEEHFFYESYGEQDGIGKINTKKIKKKLLKLGKRNKTIRPPKIEIVESNAESYDENIVFNYRKKYEQVKSDRCKP